MWRALTIGAVDSCRALLMCAWISLDCMGWPVCGIGLAVNPRQTVGVILCLAPRATMGTMHVSRSSGS